MVEQIAGGRTAALNCCACLSPASLAGWVNSLGPTWMSEGHHVCCAELVLVFFVLQAKIMVVRDIERDEIEFISKVSNSQASLIVSRPSFTICRMQMVPVF
jgi:hypothetical protein